MDMYEKIAALGKERHRLSEAWRKLWNALKLDAVICPGAQHTAVKHDSYKYPAYTAFLNVLDVSQVSASGMIPDLASLWFSYF
jgi:amidase